MRIRSSLAVSIVAHLMVIATLFFFISVKKPPVEEEITLDLTMSSQSKESTDVSEVKSATVKPLTQLVAKSTPVSPAMPEEIHKPEMKSEPSSAVASVPKSEVVVTQKNAEAIVTTPALTPQESEEDYLDNHLGAIRDLLVKYRKYPTQALRLKQEGVVKVSFRLKSNGEVEDIAIISGSGYEILDDNARELIQKTAQYFPKPAKNVRITVPLNYGIK